MGLISEELEGRLPVSVTPRHPALPYSGQARRPRSHPWGPQSRRRVAAGLQLAQLCLDGHSKMATLLRSGLHY
jgi:hypothetical protein